MKINRLYAFFNQLKKIILKKKGEISFVSAMSYATLMVTFLTQVVLARLLEPVNYGIYISSLAILALIEVPLVVRASEVSLRVLGAHWQSGGRNLEGISKQAKQDDLKYFLIPTIVILSMSEWLSQLAGADQIFFVILALMIPAQISYGIYKSYFMVFDIVPVMVKFEMSSAIVLLAATTMGYLTFGMYGLAMAYATAMLIKTFMAYMFTRSHIPTAQHLEIANRSAASHKDSFHSIFRNICSNGINQVDVIILSAIQGPHTVAIYKVAKSLSALPTKISFPVWRYLQPRLINAVLCNEKIKMQKLIFYGSAALILILALTLPFIWIAGQELIFHIYGPAYREAFKPLLILLVGVWAFNGLIGWFKVWAVVTKSPHFGLLMHFSMLAALITFGVIFGQEGALEMAYTVSSIFIAFSVLIAVKILLL